MTEETVQCSVVKALKDKYSDDRPSDFLIFAPKARPGKSADETDFHVPPNLILDKANIDCAGDRAELQKICGRVRELDLSGNSLTRWSEITMILDSIPHLNFLNLTGNILEELQESAIDATYPKLQNLILNKTQITWSSVCVLLKHVPNVNELHLSLNNLSTVDIDTRPEFPGVTKLYLNDCQISDSGALARIGAMFPNLASLVFLKNPISSIDTEGFFSSFAKLKCLNISEAGIERWEQLEKLRQLPCLTELRLQGIPLWSSTGEPLRRQMTVGYLPNITRLNGTDVTETEREDSERAFLRHYMDCEEKPKRYEELESRYGKLDPLLELDLGAVGGRISVVLCHFKEDVASEVIQIQTAWTVTELTKELLKHCKEGDDVTKLYHRDISGRDKPQALTDDQKTVSSYKVMEGDEVYLGRTPKWEQRASIHGVGTSKLTLHMKDIVNSRGYKVPLPHIKELVITGIDHMDWKAFASYFSMFMKVEKLKLRTRFLCSVTKEEDAICFARCLTNLKSLDLTDSAFMTWPEVHRLAHFITIRDLKLTGSPVWEDAPEDVRRRLVIGTLPLIEFLNGEHISLEEREVAERFCFEYYKDKETKPFAFGYLSKTFAEVKSETTG